MGNLEASQNQKMELGRIEYCWLGLNQIISTKILNFHVKGFYEKQGDFLLTC
jgi:hypothetical protein